MFKGTIASNGIALGRALLLNNTNLEIEMKNIDDAEVEAKRFLDAVQKSQVELTEVRDKTIKEFGEDKARLFDAYLLVLEDPDFIDATVESIQNEKLNAEYAFSIVRDNFIGLLETMDDAYMKERIADIKDVSSRILRNLLNVKNYNLAALDEEIILVAHDLSPSDTATMNKNKVLGFLTDIGGRTSHTAIMARSLEIPAIVGLKDITKKVSDNDILILDAINGEVILNPDSKTIENYKQLKENYDIKREELKYLIDKKTETLDGFEVELVANIGTVNDLAGVIKNGAEGVGLFRTEFLYMENDREPNEEEQFNAYKTVLETLNPKPVVIRTLDIGGDKEVPYLNIPKEMNPFLGYRAIRICLDRKEIFKTQLRALLRASIYGNLRIMFPMISSMPELLEAKALLEECKKELDNKGIEYSKNIEIGMMIEVPAVAVMSDIFAKHVDFFSIGTNDLIQYTCAVDRMNEKINHLYNQFNPGVLRLIKQVIDNGHKEGKWVGMCGEAASDEVMIPILLGMGLDEFSVSASSILPVRRLINTLKHKDAKKIADKVLDFESESL